MVGEESPLRVLMIVTSMQRGGMETFTMNVYRAMDRTKVQFDFLLHRDFKGDYDDEIERMGGRLYRIRRQNPLDPRYWHALDSFFAEHHYDVVHAQLDCLSAEPLAVAERHGAAVRVAHSHSSDQDKDLKYPIKMLCKPFIARYATHLFACGERAGSWMFGHNDFTVIKNCIDVGSYAFDADVREAARGMLGIGRETLVVGHVGRFNEVKNHAFILEVFAALLSRRPGSRLLLVGDGPLREEIECRASALGIRRSVDFLGVRPDIPSLMQAMDCFLMPSLYEGLPMVLVEAQASGLPCLISDAIPEDCDIAPNLVERVALSESPESWSSRIERLAAEPNDRAAGARDVAEAGFDAKGVAAQLQDFYLSAKAGASDE